MSNATWKNTKNQNKTKKYVADKKAKNTKTVKEDKKMAYFKGNHKGQKNNRNFGAPVKIDIEAIYRELKDAIDKRYRLEREQDSLWTYIKRTHADRSEQMTAISGGIAECTHRINRQLSQLSQYNKTHKAMSLAKGYLEKEIARLQRIAGYWNGVIRDVESGRCCLISSNGRSDTDTRSSRAYVQSRYEKIGKLTKWLEHVKRFAA